eukprot:SAG31_NODE_535_length_14348_cov_11.339603_17_plen_47_part_00
MLEQQAMDRVHRTGQTKAVKVVKLIAGSTIEDRILGVHCTLMLQNI